MGRRISRPLATHPYLVFEEDGAVLAYAYASPTGSAAYRWSVDVAVYVATEAHRRGVGRALYARLLAILERQASTPPSAG